MCGIYAYLGDKKSYGEVKLGLEKLAYRGYDSAGIVSVSKGKFLYSKVVGHPENLPDLSHKSKISIGHTRWATHGRPSQDNAHPHFSNNNKIALVHNGIIENYYEIKEFLKTKNFQFYSETDTELIPNLIQFYYNGSAYEEAIAKALRDIKGAYALVISNLNFPNEVIVVRQGSPVAIGKDTKGNFHISSDLRSFPSIVSEILTVDEGKIVKVELEGGVTVKTLNGQIEKVNFEKNNDIIVDYKLGKYSHFLEKEIFEQPIYVRNALSGRVDLNQKIFKLGGIAEKIDQILEADEVIFTGCGSAYYASCIGAQIFENYTRIRTRVIPAGELKYLNPVISEKTVMISVSQSGETADTLGCIKMAKNHHALNLGIINVVNSAIAREVHAGIYIRAGEEKSVASTKSVLNQIIAIILLSLIIASKKNLSVLEYESIVAEINSLPQKIEMILSDAKKIKKVAEKYSDYKNMICIGRGLLDPVAKEGALKIKEISYIHAEGYSAAELKHGPLALIDEDMPTIAMVNSGVLEEKMLSNIMEIKSRLGKVIAIVDDKVSAEVMNSVDDYIQIPSSTNEIFNPILFLIPLQLFSYYIALANNRPIDRPRNLAKSVSVE